MKYILILLLLSSCDISVGSKTTSEVSKKVSEYALDCERVGYDVVRCENKEAVCYVS